MWIAVCDDDTNFLKAFTNILSELADGDDQISLYSSGFELIEAVQNARYSIDMLFLDIEMPGFSGIETAKDLRNLCPQTVIVIVTNFMQYALKCYEVKAFDYLLKPLHADNLKGKIEEARIVLEHQTRDVLHIETRQENIFIPYIDILYFESYWRALYACTRTNSYQFNRSISNLSSEVNSKGFFRLHKSYIVNLSHIKRINKSEKTVVLSNGATLPIGSRNLKALAAAVIDYRQVW